MMLNTAFAHLQNLSYNVYTRKSSTTNIQNHIQITFKNIYLFKINNRNTEK